jgi:hypothetical protein
MNMKHVKQFTRTTSRSIECDGSVWYLGSENIIAEGSQNFNPTTP